MNSSGSDGATGAPVADGTEGGVGAVERAQGMRASLGARRDVETMLAEASQLRSTAAAEADALVEEAQQIFEALIAEGRERAERTRTRSQELVFEAEGAIRALSAHLEATMTSVSEALAHLADLRGDTGDTDVTAGTPVQAEAAQAPAVAVPVDVEQSVAIDEPELSLAKRFPEPPPTLAEVRASLGAGFVVIPESERPALAEVPETSGPALAEVPRTTPSFRMESASREGPATREVPTVNATQVAVDRAQTETAGETLEASSDKRPSKDPGAASRPLGWLFRSTQ